MPRQLPPELRALLERRLDPHRRARFITDEAWKGVEESFKKQKVKLVEIRVSCGGVDWLIPLRRSNEKYLCSVLEPLNIHLTGETLDSFRTELEWYLSEIDKPLAAWIKWWKDQNDTSGTGKSPTHRVRSGAARLRASAKDRVRYRKKSGGRTSQPPVAGVGEEDRLRPGEGSSSSTPDA